MIGPKYHNLIPRLSLSPVFSEIEPGNELRSRGARLSENASPLFLTFCTAKVKSAVLFLEHTKGPDIKTQCQDRHLYLNDSGNNTFKPERMFPNMDMTSPFQLHVAT